MYLLDPFVGEHVDEHHQQQRPHRVEARKRLQHRDVPERQIHLEVVKPMSG